MTRPRKKPAQAQLQDNPSTYYARHKAQSERLVLNPEILADTAFKAAHGGIYERGLLEEHSIDIATELATLQTALKKLAQELYTNHRDLNPDDAPFDQGLTVARNMMAGQLLALIYDTPDAQP